VTRDYAALLDACVLVGGGLRDTLLRLAETPRLYIPKWSAEIISEMSRVLERRFSKTPAQTAHLEYELKKAFPESWTVGYKELEPSLTSQEKDRHVLAAGAPR
jgi:hypothetical protein